MPIMPSKSPTAAIASVFNIEPPLMYASTNNPIRSSAVYSGGPNRSANDASVGAMNMSATTRQRAGDERPDRRDRERRTRAPALRHRIAIDARHDRRRLAGNAHQDRSRRAAVHRAVVNAGEQHDGDDRIQAECGGQQQADSRERSQARQHADQRADHAAGERVARAPTAAARPKIRASGWRRRLPSIAPGTARQLHLQQRRKQVIRQE